MDKINSLAQQGNIILFPSCPRSKIKVMRVTNEKCYSRHELKSFKPVLITEVKKTASQPHVAELKKSLFFLRTQIQFKSFLYVPSSQHVIHATLRRHWAMNSPRY